MTPLQTVVVPARIPEVGTVVWLHGLGASGHDFEPIVPLLARPDLRFVFPHAPMRPVTINNGYVMPAWYDIKTLAATEDREDEDDVAEATASIEALLATERARHGHPMVLLGFSQGAAMALHVGLRHDTTLAGIGVLSGYLVCGGRLADEGTPANEGTSLLFCHGRRDGVVPLSRGKAAYDLMIADGRPARWHDYPMQHEVNEPEIAVIAGWLREVLPAR